MASAAQIQRATCGPAALRIRQRLEGALPHHPVIVVQKLRALQDGPVCS